MSRQWVVTRPARLAETDLTAGLYEAWFVLVTRTVPHDETDLAPTHCPVCRHALLVVAAVRSGMSLDAAVQWVADLPAVAALEAITMEDLPVDQDGNERDGGETLDQETTETLARLLERASQL